MMVSMPHDLWMTSKKTSMMDEMGAVRVEKFQTNYDRIQL